MSRRKSRPRLREPIEILAGLKEDYKIILSGIPTYDNADRIHITDE